MRCCRALFGLTTNDQRTPNEQRQRTTTKTSDDDDVRLCCLSDTLTGVLATRTVRELVISVAACPSEKQLKLGMRRDVDNEDIMWTVPGRRCRMANREKFVASQLRETSTAMVMVLTWGDMETIVEGVE